MIDYILTLLVLFFGATSFYLVYERFKTRKTKKESSTYVKALKDLLEDKPESAFTHLRQVVAEDSSNIDAYIRLGEILRENNQPQLALEVHKDLTLRAGLSKEEKSAVLKELTSDYMAMDDFETAEKALRELMLIDSKNRWAVATLLKVHEKVGKWDEAFHTADQLLKLEGNNSKKPLAIYKYRIAKQLYGQREYHKARIVLKEAISLDPSYVPAYMLVGDSYAQEERFEDAVNFWNRLIKAVPDQGHLVIDRLKKALFDLGRFEEIIRICENILEHDPKNIGARLTLAELNEKKGDLKATADILQGIIDDYPDDLLSLLELTRICLEKGDRKRVDELLRTLELKRELLKKNSQDQACSKISVTT